MHIIYLTVKKDPNSTTPIRQLCMEFSDKSPQAMPLEGGDGINYVICIPAIDKNKIEEICSKNLYTFSELSIEETVISDSQYNSMNKVTIHYFNEKGLYGLTSAAH